MTKKLFASESVTSGHPDKMCDQISDAVLDAILKDDPEARVAIETLTTNGLVVVAGEITTTTQVDIQEIVRNKVLEIGYNRSELGFDANTCSVLVSIGAQSQEIAEGVNNSLEARQGNEDLYDEQGAGDQGLMFGYATNENDAYMPTAIHLAHKLTKRLQQFREFSNKNELVRNFLRPDGKAQVVVGYEDGVPTTIEHVLISTQHSPFIQLEELQEQVVKNIIIPVLEDYKQSLEAIGKTIDYSNASFLVNPAGAWTVGGPRADAGLTGRKIIVDTYGGFARHGGGNFQGKDPSKVDRSAAYALRWVAKNIVAAGLADRVELQVAYAIGKAKPLALYVDTFGTGKYSDELIQKAVDAVFDLRPAAIIDDLNLKHITNYQYVATYGHFGDNAASYPWEQVNKTNDLNNAIKLLEGNN
jgi:S-adenosylmethionine synthetase